jgi:hypothetical protein
LGIRLDWHLSCNVYSNRLFSVFGGYQAICDSHAWDKLSFLRNQSFLYLTFRLGPTPITETPKHNLWIVKFLLETFRFPRTLWRRFR